MSNHVLQSATLADSAHEFMFKREGLGGKSYFTGVTDSDDIYMWIFWLSTVIFIMLMGVMLYWTFKYRRVPGTIAAASSSHNMPLELAWSIIPMGFFAYMFFEGFHGYIGRLAAPPDSIELRLTGRKWNWSAVYPNGAETPEQIVVGAVKVPVFYVPEDRPVKLLMISQDVLHAFWIPDFRTKMDVQPNRYTSYWFKAARLDDGPTKSLPDGTRYRDHFAFCAEYCGDMHSEMAAIIRVVPDAYYGQVISTWNDAVEPVELGRRKWASMCSSCHSSDGTKNTGPTWKGLFGHAVDFTDGTSYTAEQMGNDEFFANYIRESILEPQKKIVAGFGPNMNSFRGQITEPQIAGITAYIKSLK